MTERIHIRRIALDDDATIAEIIRTTLGEFGCVGEGYAGTDPEVDAMTRAYSAPQHEYLVVELDGQVQGGAGYGPLLGADVNERICELRKMYFRPALRGLGAGRRLLTDLIQRMQRAGFDRCYLETVSGMTTAQSLYRSLGFEELETPRGATGHSSCDRYFELWMGKPGSREGDSGTDADREVERPDAPEAPDG